MLLLAIRTRGVPELLLGCAFLALCTIGAPLLGVSGFGAAHVRELRFPLFATGLAFIDAGALCFTGFVWRVFRPGSAWARGFVVASALVLALHIGLVLRAVSSAPPEIAPLAATAWRASLLAAVMTATFAWGAAEAFTYWRRLVRQHTLGLADAADVRRMFLFALGCGAPLVLMGLVASALARRVNPLTDPVTALGLAVAALTAGVSLTLAFGAQRGRAARTP